MFDTNGWLRLCGPAIAELVVEYDLGVGAAQPDFLDFHLAVNVRVANAGAAELLVAGLNLCVGFYYVLAAFHNSLVVLELDL